MTLNDVMALYEREMDKTRRMPTTPRRYMSHLRRQLEDGVEVYDLDEPFMLMFWRLYPNGDLASGLDFRIPNVEFGDDHRYFLQAMAGHPAIQPHRHNYLELSYVHRGALTQQVNGVAHTFRQGDVWILDRNCVHQEERFGHECFVVFVEIYGDFFDELFAQAFRHNPAGVFLKEALMEKRNENRLIHFRPREPDPDVERIFDYLLEERGLNRPGSDYVIKGLLISLFALLAANYRFDITGQQQDYLNQKLLKEIKQYLNEHCQDVTLTQLARVFSFNKNYLSRLLQTAGGMSYKELLQTIRLERAAALLIETDRPIHEIAAAVGYENTSYFYRLFKAQYQLTPQQYRAQYN